MSNIMSEPLNKIDGLLCEGLDNEKARKLGG